MIGIDKLRGVFRDLYEFAKEFDDAPAGTSPDALDYWMRCNSKMEEIDRKYEREPVVTKMLIAVWENLEHQSHIKEIRK